MTTSPDRISLAAFRLVGAMVLAVVLLLSACGPDATDEAEEEDGDEVGLTRITLSPEAVSAAGVETVEVALHTIGEPLQLPGRVIPEPDREAYITSLLSGRIEEVFAAPGDVVSRGEPMIRITSPGLGSLIAELQRARAEIDRQTRLADRGVGIRRNLQEARTNYEAARRGLLSVGLGSDLVEQIAAGEDTTSGLTLIAPISGYVLERNAVLGGPVGEGDRLFYLADLNPIQVAADAYQRDLAGLQRGMAVTVIAPADTSRRLGGVLADIVPQVDPDRRALTIRVRLPNTDGFLMPGMYATVHVAQGRGAEQPALPGGAVRAGSDGAFVLVARNDTTFERVAVGAPIGAYGYVAVSEVPLGTRVVTTGGYRIVSAMEGVEADDD